MALLANLAMVEAGRGDAVLAVGVTVWDQSPQV